MHSWQKISKWRPSKWMWWLFYKSWYRYTQIYLAYLILLCIRSIHLFVYVELYPYLIQMKNSIDGKMAELVAIATDTLFDKHTVLFSRSPPLIRCYFLIPLWNGISCITIMKAFLLIYIYNIYFNTSMRTCSVKTIWRMDC